MKHINVYDAIKTNESEHIFGMMNTDGEITVVQANLHEWDPDLALHISIEGVRPPQVWWNGKKLTLKEES